MSKYLEQLIKQLQDICLLPDSDFQSFTLSDIYSFYDDAAQFSLKLKRRSGGFILYGLPHVALRRQFFNHLPDSEKIRLFSKKLDYQSIKGWLEESLGYKLTDCLIQDIGAGTSIYKITLPSHEAWVLKQEHTNYFREYQALLKRLRLPGIPFFSRTSKKCEWLLMAHKGSMTLNQYLVKYKTVDSLLVESSAYHAFYGDIFRRGERHLENYLVDESQLFPIDVTYLYYTNNDFWTARYVAAGAYELNVCFDMQGKQIDWKRWELFWNAYLAASNTIQNDFTAYSTAEKKCIDFFLMDRKAWLSARYKAYVYNFSVFLLRNRYKQILEDISKDNLHTVSDPLKMYYYANLHRTQAFLHLEEHSQGLLEDSVTYCKEIPSIMNSKAIHKESLDFIQIAFKKNIFDLLASK